DEIAGGCQEARERRRLELDLPFLLAGDGIARVEMTPGLVGTWWRAHREVGADVELRLRLQNRSRLHHLEIHAPLIADLVVKTGDRAVGAGIEADAAADRGTKRRIGLAGAEIPPALQLARLGVDVLHEIAVLG